MINQINRLMGASKTLNSAMKIPRALIMDACPMTRGGLSEVLKKSQFNIGEVIMFHNSADILPCLKSGSPDLIVMELCGDGESVLEGLRVIATCRQDWPLIPIVVCTTLSDVRFLQQIKSLKVNSICHKHDPLESIEDCIMLARRGLYRDSPTLQRLLSGVQHSPATLTKKEINVLLHLLAGNSVSEVSRLLNRDIRTISSHKCNALVKLGYKNNGELYTRGQWMLRNGLYNLDDAQKI